MTLETYWLVIAPALLLVLSGIGWVGLWITRDHVSVPTEQPKSEALLKSQFSPKRGLVWLDTVNASTSSRGDSTQSDVPFAPPSDLHAEQALLGSLLADNQIYDGIAAFLTSEHFVDPVHGRIYQAIIRHLEAGEPVDAERLQAELGSTGVIDGGRSNYLTMLAKYGIPGRVAAEYGRAIYDTWLLRRLSERTKA
jgi:hypothetical protein